MMKLMLIFSFSLLLFSVCREEPPAPGDNDIVYVCTSNASETYHTFRDCGKLKTCRQDVLEVTRRKARENERIICMTCKKREDEELKRRDSLK